MFNLVYKDNASIISLINMFEVNRLMTKLTAQQEHQEVDYNFPYHYLDLKIEEYKLRQIEYLNYLRLVKESLKPFKGQLVLDAGCGDGRFCYEVRNENLKMVGVDYSERAIRFAQAFNPNVEFHVKDLTQLKMDGKFDNAVLIETLEHIIPKKIPTLLKNLARVLKKDGRLTITVPSVNLPMEKKHYQHFTKESLAKTLQPYFEIVEIKGHMKKVPKRTMFMSLRRLAYILYPLRHRLGLVRGLFRYVERYYRNHLAVGKPEECYGLIAVCKKI